jgi:hypothetical protein
MRFEVAGMAQEGMLDKETVYRDIFNFNDEKIAKIKEGKRFDALEDAELEKAKSGEMTAAPEGGGAPGETPPEEPGAGELPDTLGGPAPEAPAAEGLSLSAALLEKNPGSEGDDASVAVDKGKDLFAPGEDLGNHVFGTEKQTATDPYDKRATKRLITRPFSEWVDEGIRTTESTENELNRMFRQKSVSKKRR